MSGKAPRPRGAGALATLALARRRHAQRLASHFSPLRRALKVPVWADAGLRLVVQDPRLVAAR